MGEITSPSGDHTDSSALSACSIEDIGPPITSNRTREVGENKKRDRNQEVAPEPENEELRQRDSSLEAPRQSHKRSKAERSIQKNELLAKLRAGGKSEILSSWINAFLSANGGTVPRGKEGSFALRALKHVRQKWSTIHGTKENVLTLFAARWLCENTLYEICNKQSKIFRCGFCNLNRGFAFYTLLHHIVTKHREAGNSTKLLTDHDGKPADTWQHASWPENLPIRTKPIERDVEHIAFRNHMKESLWRVDKFRDVRVSERLSLWFRLNIDWYTQYHDGIPPDLESFTGAVDTFIRSTHRSIFDAVQCGVCGVLNHKNGSPWGWVDLGKHFQDLHSKYEPWKQRIIELPVGRGVDTFGEEILDEAARREWIELWIEVDERMAAESVAKKLVDTRYRPKKFSSFAARTPKLLVPATAKGLKGKTFYRAGNHQKLHSRTKANNEVTGGKNKN